MSLSLNGLPVHLHHRSEVRQSSLEPTLEDGDLTFGCFVREFVVQLYDNIVRLA